MKYYYINTDTDVLTYGPHAKWIKYDRAFTSGDYEELSAVLWLRVGFLSLGQVLLTKVRIGWYIGIRNIQNIESMLTGIFRLSAIQYVQRI